MRKTIAYFSRRNLMNLQLKFMEQGIDHTMWFESVTKNFNIAPPEEPFSKEAFLTQHKSMLTELYNPILNDECNSVEGDELSSSRSNYSTSKSIVNEFLANLNMFYFKHKSLFTGHLIHTICQQLDAAFLENANKLTFIKLYIKTLITLHSNSDDLFLDDVQTMFNMFDSPEDTYDAVNSFFTAYRNGNPSSKITMPAILDRFESDLSQTIFLKFLFALDELHNNIDSLSLNEYSELVFYGFLINGKNTNDFDEQEIANLLTIDNNELITIDFYSYGTHPNCFRNSIWLTKLINCVAASDIKGTNLFFEKIKKDIIYFTSGEETVRLINLIYLKCEKHIDESTFKWLLHQLNKRDRDRCRLLNTAVSIINTSHNTQHLSTIIHLNLDAINQLLSNEESWKFFKHLAILEDQQASSQLNAPNILFPLRDLFIKQLLQILKKSKADPRKFNDLCFDFSMDLLKQDESEYSFCVTTTGFILNELFQYIRESLSVITLYKIIHNIKPEDHISTYYFKQLKITLILENANASLNHICTDSDFTAEQKKRAIIRHTEKDDKSSLAGLIDRVLQIKNVHRLSFSNHDRLSVLSFLKQSYVGHIDSLILNMEFEEDDKLKRLVADLESEFKKGHCFDDIFIRFLNCLRAYDCKSSLLISQIRSFLIENEGRLFTIKSPRDILGEFIQLNHKDTAVINLLIEFYEATVSYFGFENGLAKLLTNIQALVEKPECNELFEFDYLKTILAFNLFLFFIQNSSVDDCAPKFIQKLSDTMSKSNPQSVLSQGVTIFFRMLFSHNKEAILKTVVQLLSSTNTTENIMGQQCVYLMINTQSSSQYITDVLGAKLTFTNRIVLLKAFFNDKRVQGEYLTEDEFSAYQSNTFVLSYKLMFLDRYECVFKPHQLVSQLDCIISQLENDYRDKNTVASITEMLSRLVNVGQNEKNKVLTRLNTLFNKSPIDLEVEKTSFSMGDGSDKKVSRDLIPVKCKYSVFSSVFGCFFKGLKRVFPTK